MPRRPSVTTVPLVDMRERDGRRRWRVRWRHQGRLRERSFVTKKEAERLATAIRRATEDGLPFDAGTGLPEAPTSSPDQLAVYTQQWLAARWQSWKPRTRASELEAAVRIVLYAVRTGSDAPPEGIRAYLARTLRPVEGSTGELSVPENPTDRRIWERDCARWVQRSSLPLSSMTPAMTERLVLRLGLLLDGVTPASSTTSRRYRTTLRALLRDAHEDGLLVTDPWTRKVAKSARATVDTTVNLATLPDRADAVRVIEHIRSSHPASETYRQLSSIALHLGLRPSEALALRWEDFELPEEGWGSVVISRTTDGEGGFGTTKTNRIRTVPVPPELVEELRVFGGDRPSGQMFLTRTGKVPTLSNWNRAVKRACRSAGVEPMTLYDFRHLNATFMLNLGIGPGEVASRLGHSVDVLLSVYAGVTTGDRERANAAIEAALAVPTPPKLRVVG